MNIPYRDALRVLTESRPTLEVLPHVVRVHDQLEHARGRWVIVALIDAPPESIDLTAHPSQLGDVDIIYSWLVYPTAVGP